MTSAAKFLGEHRPELQHPSSNRFIGDVQPALGQQIFDIAEAEGKAKIQPHGVPDDVRRELVASERDLRRPSYPAKESSATVGVTKPSSTQRRKTGAPKTSALPGVRWLSRVAQVSFYLINGLSLHRRARLARDGERTRAHVERLNAAPPGTPPANCPARLMAEAHSPKPEPQHGRRSPWPRREDPELSRDSGQSDIAIKTR